MSASHEMVTSAKEDILSLASRYSGTKEVLCTNKRIVIKCPNATIGMRLSDRVRNSGFLCEVKRGLTTPAFYIQAWF